MEQVPREVWGQHMQVRAQLATHKTTEGQLLEEVAVQAEVRVIRGRDHWRADWLRVGGGLWREGLPREAGWCW
jgi:hypothetical protein